MNKNLPWCQAGDGDRDEQGATSTCSIAPSNEFPTRAPSVPLPEAG